MMQSALDFFFDTVYWVFNDYLINIKVLGIPVLYIFIGLALLAIIINGILNTTHAGKLKFK